MRDDTTWYPPVPGPAESVAAFVAGAAGRLAAPLARPVVHATLHGIFRGSDDTDLDAPAPTGDAGWFGPGSVTWRVHADPSMFVGGIAALAFQALHPLPMAGVSDHSDFREDPLGRLRRTAAFVGVTAYGTSDDAARACAAITKVHARVVGVAPDGRPYSAADPALLGWVHAAEFAGFAAAHRRFGADPMTRAELDRYADEVARVGEALGVVEPPRSWAQLDGVLQRHRPDLVADEQARSAWHFLDHAHEWLPLPARPAYRVLFRGALACLPPWARSLWGVAMPSTVELAACRSLVRGLGALMGDPPRLVEARRRAGASSPAQSRERTASIESTSSGPLSSR